MFFSYLKPIFADGGITILMLLPLIIALIVGGIVLVFMAEVLRSFLLLIQEIVYLVFIPISIVIQVICSPFRKLSNYLESVKFSRLISYSVTKGDSKNIQYLLDNLKYSQNQYKREKIIQELTKLNNSQGINVICQDWAETRNDDLEKLIINNNWIAKTPISVKILTILKTEKLELLSDINLEEVCLVLQYVNDKDLDVVNSIDKLDLYLQNEASKSLFYFLTEKWANYEKYDRNYTHIINILESPKLANQKTQVIDKIYASNQYRWLLTLTENIIYKKTIDLISSGDQGKIFLWKIPNLITSFDSHTDAVSSLAINQFGTILVSGSKDKTIKVWDLAHQKLIGTLTNHTDIIYCVKINQRGTLFASVSGDKTIKIWKTPNQLVKTLKGHTDSVYSLDVDFKNNLLISGSKDKTIKIWNLSNGELINTLQGHIDTVCCLKINHNSSILFSGSDDNTIKIWNVKTGDLIQTLEGHSDSINSLQIDKDEKRLFSGSSDNTIKVWDIDTGEQIYTLKGHKEVVYCLQINQQSTLLVSSSKDKTIKLWNLSNYQMISSLEKNTDDIYSLQIDNDREINIIENVSSNVYRLTSQEISTELLINNTLDSVELLKNNLADSVSKPINSIQENLNKQVYNSVESLKENISNSVSKPINSIQKNLNNQVSDSIDFIRKNVSVDNLIVNSTNFFKSIKSPQQENKDSKIDEDD